MSFKQKILTSVMLGSLAAGAASCRERVKTMQPEGLSKNGCVSELQQTAECVMKNGHVRFRNGRGKVFDLMHGQLVCFGSTRMAVEKAGALYEVRFDDMAKNNPLPPAYVKVVPCRN